MALGNDHPQSRSFKHFGRVLLKFLFLLALAVMLLISSSYFRRRKRVNSYEEKYLLCFESVHHLGTLAHVFYLQNNSFPKSVENMMGFAGKERADQPFDKPKCEKIIFLGTKLNLKIIGTPALQKRCQIVAAPFKSTDIESHDCF